MQHIKRIAGWSGTPVIALIALAVLTHAAWFDPTATLFHADWGLWPESTAKDLWKNWNAWDPYNGLGQPNVQISFYLFKIIWSLTTLIGLSTTNGVQMSLLAPIALLGFLGPYFFVYRLFGNRFTAFVSAVLYGSTTYFLIRQTAHIPIAFIYALTPVLFLFIDRAIKAGGKQWLAFSLVLFVGSSFELRMILIVIPMLAIYALLRGGRKLKGQIPAISIAVTVFILLSSFWLLPTYLGNFGGHISAIANRGLFGNNLFTIDRALTLSESAWTGSAPNEFFEPQPTPLYLWLVPIFTCVSVFLYVSKRHKYKNGFVLLFGLLVLIVGIALTKQSDKPFVVLYHWLYHNVPGFNLYREASKFYIMTAVGYMLCVGYGLYALKEAGARKLYYISGFAMLFVGFANLTPLLRQEFGTMFVSRSRPTDYASIDSLHQEAGSRIMWLPNGVAWSHFSTDNPKLSAAAASSYALDLQDAQSYSSLPYAKSIPLSLFSSPGRELMDTMSVNYIAVPVRDTYNENNTFAYYNEQRDYYIEQLRADDSFEELKLPTTELKVFKNPRSRPYFDIHSNIYHVDDIKNVADIQDLVPDSGLSFTKDDGGHAQNISNVLQGTGPAKSILSENLLLVARQKDYKLSYVVANDHIQLIQDKLVTALDSNEVAVNSQQTGIGQIRYDSSKRYFAYNGSDATALPLTNSTTPRSLGFFSDNLSFYSIDPQSTLVNEDFNGGQGVFSGTLQDCNPYDQSPLISAETGSDTKDDTRGVSLIVTSHRHTACVGPSGLRLPQAASLYIAFDYKFEGTNQTALKITFDTGEVIYRDIFRQTGVWRTFETFIDIPTGATSFNLQLHGFPNDRRNEVGATYLDNVKVSGATKEFTADLPPSVDKFALNSGTYDVARPFSNTTSNNLVPNPSFAEGLWTERVGDCNAYDSSPDIGMSLDPAGSAGSNAVRLEAARHVACTGPSEKIPVKEGEAYSLEFDYSSPNAKDAGFYIGFNDPERTSISEKIKIVGTGWQRYQKTIVIPYGATNASLTVYSYPDEVAGTRNITLYDNFLLASTAKVDDYLYSIKDQGVARSAPRSLSFSLDGTTSRTVNIKGAKEGFYMSMAEAYHPGWAAAIMPRNKAGARDLNSMTLNEHIQINGWQNAWYVDTPNICNLPELCTKNEDGTYDMELTVKFTPPTLLQHRPDYLWYHPGWVCWILGV